MSISLITKIWPLDIQTGRKFVLLAICDVINDDGEGFMCVNTIAFKCGMSARAVQGHLSYLEKTGLILRTERPGRSNIFSVNLDALDTIPKHPLWIEREKTRSKTTPADSAPPPADSAPITITNTLPNLKPYARAREDFAANPDSPHFEIFPEIENRKLVESWEVICRTKKVPITQEACDKIRNEAKISGMPVEQALEICRDRKWAGFKNSWLSNLPKRNSLVTPIPGETLAASHQSAKIDRTTPTDEQHAKIQALLPELKKFKVKFVEKI